ncbi:MAG: hypothetical protein ACOCYE_09900 [Pseudomonadota bacterium]
MMRVLPFVLSLAVLPIGSSAAPLLEAGAPAPAARIVVPVEDPIFDEARALFEITTPPGIEGAEGIPIPRLPATAAGAFVAETLSPTATYELRVTGDFTDPSLTDRVTTMVPLPGTALLLGTVMAVAGLYRLRGEGR